MVSFIKKFFDHLAPTYAHKYSSEQPYLQYFFTTRLELATAQLPLANKTILDIGAGTGALYDFLKKQDLVFSYYACDISEKMLQASAIPEEHRFVGEVDQIEWPVEHFDYIFALGLTSYLDDEQMERLLRFCAQHLSPEGRVIVSFTNRSAVEVRIRYLLQPFVRKLFRGKKRVFSQPFKTRAYSLGAAKEAFVAKNLYYCNLKWGAPFIPFLHHWMPRWSVKTSKYLASKKFFLAFNRWFSHEFMLSFQVNGTKNKHSQNRS
jgi:2-polyprenyl-3-methyl-5-hydroxy-6-metoxy-1,4-benzoquinol methylase